MRKTHPAVVQQSLGRKGHFTRFVYVSEQYIGISPVRTQCMYSVFSNGYGEEQITRDQHHARHGYELESDTRRDTCLFEEGYPRAQGCHSRLTPTSHGSALRPGPMHSTATNVCGAIWDDLRLGSPATATATATAWAGQMLLESLSSCSRRQPRQPSIQPTVPCSACTDTATIEYPADRAP